MIHQNFGHEVVLVSETAIASETLGSTQIGFISALPENILNDRIAKIFFNVDSDENGIAKRAPYRLAKVEAKLKGLGIDAVIASPYQLYKVIGERTKMLAFVLWIVWIQLRLRYCLLDDKTCRITL
ncbi:MAG: hypothetical protein ACP5F1_03500 [Thermoplasmata archaeon]